MRIAALYDIHGNLPALEAVLDELRRVDVDQIVIGGDVVPGPMPRETLASLLDLELSVHFIQGNGEADVLAEMTGAGAGRVPEPFRDVVRWTARQLQPEDQQVLASWPKALRIEIDSLGEVLFCHATPRDDNEIFTRLTSEDRLLSAFAGVDAPVVVCGHTHMPFDRRIGETRVVNAGSVGMPFGKTGADWLLLGPDVEPRHTSFDLQAAAERLRATPYPRAHEFAEHHVLQVPSEEAMLEVFAGGELK